MVKITPVLEKDLKSSLNEFLSDDFNKSRLGRRMLIACSEGQSPTGFDLSSRECEAILCGDASYAKSTVPCTANGISAWCFSFGGCGDLNILHALAPEKTALSIREAHLDAAVTVLLKTAGSLALLDEERRQVAGLLETSQGLSSASPHANEMDEPRRYDFLVFTAAASRQQGPRLHTTAFLRNTAFGAGNQPQALVNPEDIERCGAAISLEYADQLQRLAKNVIGPYRRSLGEDQLRIVGIPQEVVRKFQETSIPPADKSTQNGTWFGNKPLYNYWRAQAASLGWGPKDAAAFLGKLRREQFWSEVKAKCVFAMQNPKDTFRNALNRVSSTLDRPKEQGHQIQSKERDLSHSH